MEFAGADFARARTDVDGAMPWNHCFDAQQTAEKALKAVMVARDIPVLRTCDIAALMGELRKGGVAVPASLKSADELSDYAEQTRYPGPLIVTRTDRKRAVRAAAAVLEWAKAEIERAAK